MSQPRRIVINGGRKSLEIPKTRYYISAELIRQHLPPQSVEVLRTLIIVNRDRLNFLLGCRLYFLAVRHCMNDLQTNFDELELLSRACVFEINHRFGKPLERDRLVALSKLIERKMNANIETDPVAEVIAELQKVYSDEELTKFLFTTTPKTWDFDPLQWVPNLAAYAESSPQVSEASKASDKEFDMNATKPRTPKPGQSPIAQAVDKAMKVAPPRKVAGKATERKTPDNVAKQRQENARRAAKDPRTVEQKAASVLYLNGFAKRVDKKLESFPVTRNPRRLDMFMLEFVTELGEQIPLTTFMSDTAKCGYPPDRAAYAVIAFVMGYAASKLSRRLSSPAGQQAAASAVDEALIYPPPEIPEGQAYADLLSRLLHGNHQNMANGVIQKVMKSASTPQGKAPVATATFSEIEERTMSNANETGAPATDAAATGGTPDHSDNITPIPNKPDATDAAATAAADAAASTAGAAAADAASAADGAGATTKKDETSNTTTRKENENDYFSWAGLIAGIVMLLLIGLVTGAMTFIITTYLMPWVLGLGLATAIVALIVGAVAVIVGGVALYGIYKIGQWVFSLAGGVTGTKTTTTTKTEQKVETVVTEPAAAAV